MDAKQVPWKSSRAKKTLREALEDGRIPLDPERMGPHEVYKKFSDFQEIDFDRFRTNLNRMRQTMSEKKNRATTEAEMLRKDRETYPKQMVVNGKPRWEGSVAEQQLKADIDAGKTLNPPATFRASNEAYQVFPSATFRNHIYQAKQKVKWNNYLDSEKEKKKKKKP